MEGVPVGRRCLQRGQRAVAAWQGAGRWEGFRRHLRHLHLLLWEERGVLHQEVRIPEHGRKLAEELTGLCLQVPGGRIQTSQSLQFLKGG
jgi:hypothetical protein